ncbi:MAG: HAMP domain-containing sensor histidine kinase, partial [Bacteroidaceae bacterium]
VKFTERGCILVGYSQDKQAREILIYVTDTGKGIPEEEQKIIFDRFYKQDEFAQGTGLGLSICQVIIEKLKGHITLFSQINKGSKFTIHLPY